MFFKLHYAYNSDVIRCIGVVDIILHRRYNECLWSQPDIETLLFAFLLLI